VQQLEERLKAQLLQLWSESENFQRLMYKNKNQHRRCLYYRALSKVRRDLRLFETADLKNILNKYFQIIGRNNPAQAINPLERQISTLLGQSFFMPFALTMLALLARLRVLLQQTLHDVVCVFNIFSSVSEDGQSFKLKDEGLKVFRDYCPSHELSLSLECHWDGVKFCLLEKQVERKRNIPEMAMNAAELEQDSFSFGKKRRKPSTSAPAKKTKGCN